MALVIPYRTSDVFKSGIGYAMVFNCDSTLGEKARKRVNFKNLFCGNIFNLSLLRIPRTKITHDTVHLHRQTPKVRGLKSCVLQLPLQLFFLIFRSHACRLFHFFLGVLYNSAFIFRPQNLPSYFCTAPKVSHQNFTKLWKFSKVGYGFISSIFRCERHIALWPIVDLQMKHVGTGVMTVGVEQEISLTNALRLDGRIEDAAFAVNRILNVAAVGRDHRASAFQD